MAPSATTETTDTVTQKLKGHSTPGAHPSSLPTLSIAVLSPFASPSTALSLDDNDKAVLQVPTSIKVIRLTQPPHFVIQATSRPPTRLQLPHGPILPQGRAKRPCGHPLCLTLESGSHRSARPITQMVAVSARWGTTRIRARGAESDGRLRPRKCPEKDRPAEQWAGPWYMRAVLGDVASAKG